MPNNRGQTLVVFILLLPILFMIAAIIVDSGILFNEKRKIDNTIKEALNYGINHISEDEVIVSVEKLINKNISNINELEVNINNDIIIIELKKTIDSIFSFIFGNSSHKIEANYRGYKENNDIIIKEE